MWCDAIFVLVSYITLNFYLIYFHKTLLNYIMNYIYLFVSPLDGQSRKGEYTLLYWRYTIDQFSSSFAAKVDRSLFYLIKIMNTTQTFEWILFGYVTLIKWNDSSKYSENIKISIITLRADKGSTYKTILKSTLKNVF